MPLQAISKHHAELMEKNAIDLGTGIKDVLQLLGLCLGQLPAKWVQETNLVFATKLPFVMLGVG